MALREMDFICCHVWRKSFSEWLSRVKTQTKNIIHSNSLSFKKRLLIWRCYASPRFSYINCRINLNKLEESLSPFIFCCIWKNLKKLCEVPKAKRMRLEILTVRVAFLPDSIHTPVRFNPQKKASVFTVQSLGVLEAPRRKATSGAVLRYSGKCCNFSRGHLLLSSCFLATASSPSWEVQEPCRGLPPPTNFSLLPFSAALHTNWFHLTSEVSTPEKPPLRAESAL